MGTAAGMTLRFFSSLFATTGRRTAPGFVIVLLVASCSAFFQLGATKLWDRDEPRNANCAREMLERNDWIVPVFNGELRTHKPILLYWEMMLGYSIWGVNEFTARLPSAVLGIGTCLLTWWIGRRLYSPAVGLLAGCALATSLMFVVATRAATPDSTLIFFITASLAAFVYGFFPSHGDGPLDGKSSTRSDHADTSFGGLSLRNAIFCYVLMALAVLAKGPVGFVLPTAVIGLFLLISTRAEGRSHSTSDPATRESTRRGLIHRAAGWLASVFHPLHFLATTARMRPLTAAACLLIVALPWYVWVGIRTDGEWLRGFFWEHNLGRATRAMEGHDGSAFWFYPAAILFGFFPWSLFALPVGLHLIFDRGNDRHRHATTLLLCWLAVVVGLFSLAKTKLPSYVTPAYPALAILTAHFLVAWCRKATTVDRRWMRLAYVCAMTVGIGMLVAMPIVAERDLPGDAILGLLGLIPLALGVSGWWAVRHRPSAIPTLHIAAALAVVLLGFGWGAVRVGRHQRYDELLRAFPANSDIPVAALACLEPSWVFYSNRTIYELSYPQAETSQPPADSDAQVRPGFRPQIPLDDFLARHPRAHIIMTDRGWKRLGTLRRELEIVTETTRFLKSEQLYLVRRKSTRKP